MQNLQLFFKKNPDKKIVFVREGKIFNKKYLKKYNEKNLQNIKAHKKLEFPSKWKAMKPAFKKLRGEMDTFMRCYICGKQLNDIYVKDIEHYRPKGSKGNPKERQYWWLAYDYENYYISCADCNRAEKKNAFPIFNEKNKADYFTAQTIDNEEPLLLNPMIDNPSNYFRLVFIIHPKTRDKKIAILLPKKNLPKNSIEYLKAKTTIEIFNLDLKYLQFLNHPEIKKNL